MKKSLKSTKNLSVLIIILVYLVGFCFTNVATAETSVTAETFEDIEKLFNCLPPPTIGCTNQQAYDRLVWTLQQQSLIGSEIAKDQLVACTRDIQTYQQILAAYNACPVDQKIPASNEADVKKYALPFLCPLLLGGRGGYDSETTKCECGKSYLLYENQCQTPLEICQQKYGDNITESMGTCGCQRGYTWNDTHTTCLEDSSTPTPLNSMRPQPFLISVSMNQPDIFKKPSEEIKTPTTRDTAITLEYVRTSPTFTPTVSEQKNDTINWFSRIINTIGNFFRSILYNGQ